MVAAIGGDEKVPMQRCFCVPNMLDPCSFGAGQVTALMAPVEVGQSRMA